jgi:hypothetical protein
MLHNHSLNCSKKKLASHPSTTVFIYMYKVRVSQWAWVWVFDSYLTSTSTRPPTPDFFMNEDEEGSG